MSTTEWREVELGDVIDLHDSKRKPLSGKERSTRQGIYPYYGASGVIDHLDDYMLDGNYLLVSEDGENLNSRKLPIAFWARGKFWVNNHAHIILGKEGKANTDFIRLWLLQANISGYITGAAQPKLSQGNLCRIKLNIPNIETQNKIASVLSNYDNLIENNSRRIAILEGIVQSLYREWFVKFRFPGHVGVKFKSSTLGEIPETWKVGVIKDLGVVHTGKTPSKKKGEYYASNDIPFLKTPDMHGSVFAAEITDYLSSEGADSQKNKYIPKDSICVSCIGARAGVVTITASVVQTNQQINSIILNDVSMREYFYLFAVSLHDKIHAIGSSGATMTNVSKGKFETIEVIIPPKEILDKFNVALKSQFDLILNLQKRNNNLKKQRDMLLPKLISGSIDV